MSWKLRLSLIAAAIFIAVIWVKLPSQADTNVESAAQEEKGAFQLDKVTKYENGTMKVQPQNFAVSRAVRDMPTTDPDALVNRANYADGEEVRETAGLKKNKQAETSDDDGDGDINELNTKTIKKIIPGAGAGAGDGLFEDPLLKKQRITNGPESPMAMPTPSLTFDGATAADNAAVGVGNLIPPDVNGDVGPNHYVSSVNSVLKMFNKSGAILAGPIKTNALFASLPASDVCRTSNQGDPIVLYDSLADRWHITQFGFNSTTAYVNYQCVALSKTGDPTGEYYVWSYAYPLEAFNDYPKVGVWTDAYHMTFNQFSRGGGSPYLGAGILSQDRKKALIGDPNAVAVYTNLGDLDRGTYGTLPGDIDGFVPPPAGLPEIIGETLADEAGDPIDGVRIYKWIPNFDNPGNSALTVLGDVRLAPFDFRSPPTTQTSRPQIEQLGGPDLSALADRSMHRFAYRNFGTQANPVNSYAGNFTVNVSGVAPTTDATYQAGIRWFEMRRVNDAFSVFDQGTHNLAPGNGATGLNNWMSSIAQDGNGDIAIGFSQAGTTQRADIKIAGRTNNVQNSGTLNEGEALFHAATGSQTSPSGRWGDYSAMNVDPTDDCTFWYTQEYYAVTSDVGWSTRVGKFRYPQCTDAPKASIQGTVTNCSTGAVISGVSVDATGGFNRVTNTNGTFSLITSSPATYNVTASKFGFINASQSFAVANGQTQTADFCLTPAAVVSASGNPQIVAEESCGVANGTLEPGERLTIGLPLQNNGSAPAANLTATLQTGGGVTSSSGTQNFGSVAANGGSATRNFTFTVDPNLSCGSIVTLTFNINDGTNSLGTITKTYTTGARTALFTENFDNVTVPALPAGWTNVPILGATITWITQNPRPSSTPNNVTANEPGTPATAALVSPAIQIPTASARLSFKNFYNTETGFDGMVLEYSTNNGSTWTDITNGGTFVSGGYNGSIDPRTDSTLIGRAAWTGSATSAYIDTVVNLPASLNNQTVKFRWVFATDSGGTGVGVRIDDVQVSGASQCNTCSSGPVSCQFRNRNSFDSDSRADVSVFRPESGMWYILSSQTGFFSTQFGISTDKIVPADYDGDGKTDIAVYRNGTWYLQRPDGGYTSIQFGLPDDIPQPADFDGDCKADIAVFRPSNGVWYVMNSTNGAVTAVQFGISTDLPVVSDYDGDGKADYAVYRPLSGTWYVLQSSNGGFQATQFGVSTDKPVVGDYDGDGKADEAVYRPDIGTWYILRSRDGFAFTQFGISTDLPVPSDYDGDGKTDVAVFRLSSGTWYEQRSTEGFAFVQFGLSTDRPIPNALVP